MLRHKISIMAFLTTAAVFLATVLYQTSDSIQKNSESGDKIDAEESQEGMHRDMTWTNYKSEGNYLDTIDPLPYYHQWATCPTCSRCQCDGRGRTYGNCLHHVHHCPGCFMNCCPIDL